MRCIVSSAESAGGIINSERNVIARTAITVFATSSMREVLESLVPGFAQASGYQVAVSYDAANLILRRVRNGESADVAVLAGSAIKQLTDLGVVEPASCTDLARSGIGMAVRAGASRPDIGSIEAFKRVLLAAESVAYTTEGASGVYFTEVIERLGITSEIQRKAKTRPAGLIGELVMTGEAEVAIQQIPELMAVSGIELVGPLPGDLHRYITLTAAIFTDATQRKAARAFVDFLTTPDALRSMKAHGMERA